MGASEQGFQRNFFDEVPDADDVELFDLTDEPDEIPDVAANRTDGVLVTDERCVYRGCENQRFAQHRFCVTHYQKLSWVLDRSWDQLVSWPRWAAAIVIASIGWAFFIL